MSRRTRTARHAGRAGSVAWGAVHAATPVVTTTSTISAPHCAVCRVRKTLR